MDDAVSSPHSILPHFGQHGSSPMADRKHATHTEWLLWNFSSVGESSCTMSPRARIPAPHAARKSFVARCHFEPYVSTRTQPCGAMTDGLS